MYYNQQIIGHNGSQSEPVKYCWRRAAVVRCVVYGWLVVLYGGPGCSMG